MELPAFKPTEYKISTITATGSINTSVNLDAFFEHMPVLEAGDPGEGVLYAEYGIRKNEIVHKGYPRKPVSTRKLNTGTKKRFDNQVTIVYRFIDDTHPIASVNSKVFKNGNVQMTGLRYIEQGHLVLGFIIATLKRIYAFDKTIVANMDDLGEKDYRIRLINCDFKLGFEIKRERLFRLVMNAYKVPCSYEPCIYPGVKIQYWWNAENVLKDGYCYCSQCCNGKGHGHGEGECKKITIAVFQSGCIIITGGQSIEQIDEAYKFTCDCIQGNLAGVVKFVIQLPEVEAKRKKVYIKKSRIRPLS